MPGTTRKTLSELGVTRAQVRAAGELLGPARRIGDLLGPLFLTPGPVTVLRPEDLLLLRFSFSNLTLSSRDGTTVLRRFAAGHPARVVVDFPPQHLVEQSFNKEAVPQESPQRPVITSLAGHSRVVLDVGDGDVEYSLDGLLDALGSLPLAVAPHATRPQLLRDLVSVVVTDGINAVARSVGPASRAVELARARGRLSRTSALLESRLGPEESLLVASGWSVAGEVGLGVPHVPPWVVAGARPKAPRAPTDTETALELPWRLFLSPSDLGGFAHSSTPSTHGGRTELWHSRLGSRSVGADGVTVTEDAGRGMMVRAIWARDLDGHPEWLTPTNGTIDLPPAQESVRRPIKARERIQIVHETSNQTLTRANRPWAPQPVSVRRLMLSTLGGWLTSDLQVDKLPSEGLNLTEWRHRATLGRDHYVKISLLGFLFPFGHRALLVQLTERKFTPDQPGNPAYLYFREYLVIQERTRTYSSTSTYHDARDYLVPPSTWAKRLDLSMPIASASVLTRVTPDLQGAGDLDDVGNVSPSSGSSDRARFPIVDGKPFPFALLVTDREGNVAEYTGPLLWIPSQESGDLTKLAKVVKSYYLSPDAYRAHHLDGARLAFAPSLAPDHRSLDTVLETQTMRFDAAIDASYGGGLPEVPNFRPILRDADVVVPSASAVAGRTTSLPVRVPQYYASNGLNGNKAHVFLEALAPPPLIFSGSSDRSGGFVAPDMEVKALSGSVGPVGAEAGDAATMTSISAGNFFGDAKLFGAVPLEDIIGGLGIDTMPRFVADTVDLVTGLQRDLARVIELANALSTSISGAGGQAAALVASVDAVKDAASDVVDAVADFEPGDDLAPAFAALGTSLGTLADDVAAAAFVPAGLRTELAGVLRRLTEALAAVTNGLGIVDLVVQSLQGLALPETLRARLSWSVPLHSGPSSAVVFQPRKAGSTDAVPEGHLDLVSELTAPVTSGKDPTASVACSISPFRIQLIGPKPWIALNIEKISLVMVTGRKVEVDVVLLEGQGVVFGGPLGFVNVLRTFIPFDGLSDPPYLDVETSGIRAGFDLELPPITVGVMSLTRVTLGAELRVPFIGESLDFRFSFCTRERPCLLTVWLFGGGAFFAVTVSPGQSTDIEAAFEFGAAVVLDFGVASGSIECMAGIYFRLEDGTSQLAGYFRLRGEVDVLGLISASIELYLELSYESATNTAVGRATLTIEVEVLFFSASVKLECEKRFNGSPKDPTFEEVMGPAPGATQRPWDDYCAAFAA